jgi:hypothetical protein
MDEVVKALTNTQTERYMLQTQHSRIYPAGGKFAFWTPRYPLSGLSKDAGKKESIDVNA